MSEDNNVYASCCICLEDLDVLHMTTYLPCRHRFHIACINNFLLYQIRHRNTPRCPLCNAAIDVVVSQTATPNTSNNGRGIGMSIVEFRRRPFEGMVYIMLGLLLLSIFIFILFANL